MLTSGFFNSVGHDRRYDAEQMSSIFDGIIRDGIFMSIGDQMRVLAHSDWVVTVETGRAWFDHTWTLNTSKYPLDISPAHMLYDRIDAIVLEVNHELRHRKNYLKVIKGPEGANPAQKPTLIRSEKVNQYPLAYISIPKASTKVTQGNITSTIGTMECPYVTGILETITFDDLIIQWRAQWEEMMQDKDADWDQWLLEADHDFQELLQVTENTWDIWFDATMKNWSDFDTTSKFEWNEWFEGVKTEWTESVTMRVWREIQTLQGRTTNLEDRADQLRIDVDDLSEKHDQDVADLNSDISDLNGKLETAKTELNTKISNLQNELTRTQDELDALETKHTQDVTKLTNDLNTLNDKHVQDVTKLTTDFNNLAVKESQDVTKLTNDLNALNTKHTQDVTAINKTISDLETKHDQDIAAVQKTISDLDKEVTDTVKVINEKISGLRTDLNALTTQHNQDVADLNTKIGKKQDTITGAATTITSANLTTNRALISNGSGKVAVSAVTSTELGYLDGATSNIQNQINSKLGKTTYEYNKEFAFGSSGKLCIGKFPCYDTNISVEIKSTTNVAYNGVLIVATQNINTSGGGTLNAYLYGDENHVLTNRIKMQYGSGSNVVSIYADLPGWSKNLIHIQCVSPAAAPTDIATSVTEIPSAANRTPKHADYFRSTAQENVALDSITENQIGYVSGTSGILGQNDGAIYKQVYSSAWVHEIYGDYRTGQIAVRGKNNGTWQAWRKILDSSNYSSYAVPLSGGTMTGKLKAFGGIALDDSTTSAALQFILGIDAFASGGTVHWQTASDVAVGIASKLKTARKLTIGDTGKMFDGSANVSWTLSEIGAMSDDTKYALSDTIGGIAKRTYVLYEQDNRSKNEPPSYYMDSNNRGIRVEFKNWSTIGIPDGSGTYVQLLTFTPWGDGSGGYPAQMAVCNSNGRIYYRIATSNSAWGTWWKLASMSSEIFGGSLTLSSSQSTVINALINSLETASGTPVDNSYYISQINDGSNNTYYRRTHLALYNYMLSKFLIRGTTNSSIGTPDAAGSYPGIYYVGGTASILGQGDGALYQQVYSTSWIHQIYADYRTGQIAVRGKNGGTWKPWRKVLDSENYTQYLTGSSAPVNKIFKQTIDLSNTSTYAENTWYPCVGTAFQTTNEWSFNIVDVNVQLNSGTKPSWSQHGGGFSVNLVILAISSGWGTTYANSICLANTYRYANANPAAYTQLTNSSCPVLYLRGGGKYFVRTSYNCSWSPKTASFTASSQTVSPTTTAPTTSINRSIITAALNGNVTGNLNGDVTGNLNGKVLYKGKTTGIIFRDSLVSLTSPSSAILLTLQQTAVGSSFQDEAHFVNSTKIVSGAVADSGNGTVTTFKYSAAGLTSASWLAAWNGYELRAISPANLANLLGTKGFNAVGKNGFVVYPNGGVYNTQTSSITGYLRVKLPVGFINTMMKFTVSIYNYSNVAMDYVIAGYPYSGNKGWHYCDAYCIAPYDSESALSNLEVSFGSLDSKPAITIGAASTVWAYPQVVIHDILIGYNGATYSNYNGAWTIDFSTTGLNSPVNGIGGTNIARKSRIANFVGIQHSNELNIYGMSSASMYFNYRSATTDGNLPTAITNYYFGNGQKGYTGVTLNAANLKLLGKITTELSTGSYIAGNQGTAIINSIAAAGYNVLARMKSTNGVFTIACYNGDFDLYYTKDDVISNGTNTFTHFARLLSESGISTFKNLTVLGGLTVDRASSTNSIEAPSIELSYATPYIDFHYNKSTSDYTARLIADANNQLNIIASSGVKINGQVLDDHIIAHGTSNGWYYWKWRSGLYICYSPSKFNDNFSNIAQGGIYVGSLISFGSYPSAFVEVPVTFAECVGTDNGSYNNISMFVIHTTGTASVAPIYNFARGSTATVGHPRMRIVAIGRWK